MKRAVLCVSHPEMLIPQCQDYSLMIINPDSSPARLNYLLDKSDYSLLITDNGIFERNGGDYDEAALWYTSGTTGDSKFCSFTQQQLDNLAATICASYEINHNDRYLSIMPLWHAHGIGMYWAMRQAKCGIKFVKPAELRSQIDYSPTIVSAVPDLLRLVMRQTFSDLRFVRSASAALPNDLYDDLRAWSRQPVLEAFGMTESCSHCFTNPLHGEQKPGTVGLPSGIEADIRDQHLWIRGPSVYQPAWIYTGDLVEMDNFGYFKILGRAVDTLNIRGYKINPVSIEQQLMTHFPSITGCVIFGTNKLKCLFTGEVDVDTITKFLVEISAFCRPSLIQQVDAIPVNDMGKISRASLTRHFQ